MLRLESSRAADRRILGILKKEKSRIGYTNAQSMQYAVDSALSRGGMRAKLLNFYSSIQSSNRGGILQIRNLDIDKEHKGRKQA